MKDYHVKILPLNFSDLYVMLGQLYLEPVAVVVSGRELHEYRDNEDALYRFKLSRLEKLMAARTKELSEESDLPLEAKP